MTPRERAAGVLEKALFNLMIRHATETTQEVEADAAAKARWIMDDLREAGLEVVEAGTVEALRECAEDLAAHVCAEYGVGTPEGVHPALKRRYERDMGPVRRARALLPDSEVSNG